MQSLLFLVHRVTFAKFPPEIAAAFSFAPTQLFRRIMWSANDENDKTLETVLSMIGYFAETENQSSRGGLLPNFLDT